MRQSESEMAKQMFWEKCNRLATAYLHQYIIAYGLAPQIHGYVDDAVQETLLAVFSKMEADIPSDEIENQLGNVAHNKLVDEIRKHIGRNRKLQPVGQAESSEILAGIESAQPNLADMIATKELAGKVMAYLEENMALDQRWAKIAWKVFVQGKSYRQVCDELEIHRDTVAKDLENARIRIKEKFPKEFTL